MVTEQQIKGNTESIYRKKIVEQLKQVQNESFLRKVYYLILAYQNRVGL